MSDVGDKTRKSTASSGAAPKATETRTQINAVASRAPRGDASMRWRPALVGFAPSGWRVDRGLLKSRQRSKIILWFSATFQNWFGDRRLTDHDRDRAPELLGASVTTRLVTSLLFGVSAIDPITIVSAVVLLGIVAVCASYLPTRTAAKVDPVVALRGMWQEFLSIDRGLPARVRATLLQLLSFYAHFFASDWCIPRVLILF